MSVPVRLQLCRRKGFDLQKLSRETNGLEAVNVARPSKWGNPHRVGADETYYGGHGHESATAEQCVALYRRGIEAEAAAERGYGFPEPLRGRNLACWCRLGDACHTTVLLELANRPVCDEPAEPPLPCGGEAREA